MCHFTQIYSFHSQSCPPFSPLISKQRLINLTAFEPKKDNIIGLMNNAIPSDQEWKQEDPKSQASPSPTNTSSFSDLHSAHYSAYERAKNQRKYSHPVHRKRNWNEIESSVLEYLTEIGVRLGHPEDVICDVYEMSKKQVVKNLANAKHGSARCILHRKMARKLTIML